MSAVTDLEIDANSTMAEVLRLYPGAQRTLFRKYHIGGCSSCGFQPSETLGDLCARNGGLNVAEVIDHITRGHEADLQILVDPQELARWRNENVPMRLLDIRTREEYDAVRIEGAILFTQEIMNTMLASWPRAELLVIYDHLGTKSMDAAAYFLGHGFNNVRALRGGIEAWSVEVDPQMRRYKLQ
jgi:rhodanese-related sulfurtransferase